MSSQDTVNLWGIVMGDWDSHTWIPDYAGISRLLWGTLFFFPIIAKSSREVLLLRFSEKKLTKKDNCEWYEGAFGVSEQREFQLPDTPVNVPLILAQGNSPNVGQFLPAHIPWEEIQFEIVFVPYQHCTEKQQNWRKTLKHTKATMKALKLHSIWSAVEPGDHHTMD